MKRIKVIDSHTGGEPTRIIVEGGPDLGGGSLADRLERFRDEFDEIRSAVIHEPRGSDVLVGGLLCEPVNSECTTGVIFFDNAGYLQMCGHGTIGLMVTLHHLGRISGGKHCIETPVGEVVAELETDGTVAVENVPSYRLRKNVYVEVPGYGEVMGDVAWGGNWFFLVKDSTENLIVQDADYLTRVTLQIRKALEDQGITGTDRAGIHHVELFGEPANPENDSRNFVLCPGGAYDRSPCGTGSSAKLACLAADGILAEGQMWRQEGIVGSVFTCSYRKLDDDRIAPTIRGTAYVCSEASLILDPGDPFCMGIRQ